MTNKRIFRFKIDLICVCIVVAALSLQVTAVIAEWPWYVIFLIIPLLRQVSLVQHNHAHLGVFFKHSLNEVFGWLCFLSNGIPLEFYRTHHVRNHHRYNQRFDDEAEDWSSTFGFRGTRFPDVPIGKAYYVLTFPVITASSCIIYLLRLPGTIVLRRFVRSVLVWAAGSLALGLTNPEGFLFFFVIPWLVISFGHGFNNYDHHYGCNMTDPLSSANERFTFFSKTFGFNIGYHIEHHLKPSLHWSKLPRFHREICSSITSDRVNPKKPNLIRAER